MHFGFDTSKQTNKQINKKGKQNKTSQITNDGEMWTFELQFKIIKCICHSMRLQSKVGAEILIWELMV